MASSLPLVVIDSARRRARRYWPKPDGHGYCVDEAVLVAPEDQTSKMAWEIEHFRQGPEKKKNVPMTGGRA